MVSPADGGGADRSGARIGPYRVVERIGRGGMGEVYLGRDVRLDRDVALKVPAPELAADPVARARFVRETRHASRVVHPYVATVFDVVENGEELLLVMEYIEGRSLRELLRDGAIDPDRILRWAAEIGEALVAIHGAGLVHRDLKPGNVMITPADHVKVMDFGLAANVGPGPGGEDGVTETALTGRGIGVGTVLYMSPEQLRGLPVEPTSDLFSFGVLLYEAATGTHPFRRRTLVDSSAAILSEPPGTPAAGEGLPPELAPVVLRMLEKRPEDRYASAADALADLSAIGSGSTRVAVLPHRSRRAVRIAIAFVVVAVAVGSLAFWLGLPPARAERRLAVAVLPFDDRTGQPDGPIRASMIADLLASDVESSRFIRIVGPREAAPLLAAVDPSDPADLAARARRTLAADYVLLGTLYREGERYLGTVHLQATVDGLPEIEGFRAEGATVLDLAETVATALRRAVPSVSGLNAWRDDRADLESLTSSSAEARILYERGQQAKRDGRLLEAVECFGGAIEADPDFCLATIRLAETYFTLGDQRRAREAASRAIELDPEDTTLAGERLSLMIRAVWSRVYARPAEGDRVTAVLAELYPDEPGIQRLRASALAAAGEFERSVEAIDRAIELAPADPTVRLARGEILLNGDRHEDAFRDLDEAERLFSAGGSEEGLASVAFARGRSFLLQERFAEALDPLLDAADRFEGIGRPIGAAESLIYASAVEINQGKPAAAIERLDPVERVASEAGNRGLLSQIASARGAAAMQLGKFDDAEVYLRQAIDLARQLENDSLRLDPQVNLASLLRYLGRSDEALRAAEEARRLARTTGEDYGVEALLVSWGDDSYSRGDIRAALDAYREVVGPVDGPPTRNTALAAQRLAEAEETTGRLADALRNADRAVEDCRTLDLEGHLGFALAARARIRARLGRFDGAHDDLREAVEVAGLFATGSENLARILVLSRGTVFGLGGRWDEAAEIARTALSSAPDGVSSGRADMLACEAEFGAGRFDRAVDACRRLAGNDGEPVPDRIAARSLESFALLLSGRAELAAEAAGDAFEKAHSMESWFSAARSAAVLAETSRIHSPEESRGHREAGRDALERFLMLAPAGDDRRFVKQREDVRVLEDMLSKRVP